MKQVNIYTASTIRGPRRRSGRTGYILEYIPEHGDKAQIGKIEPVEDMTEQQAALTVINHALIRITGDCQIRIFTECEAILTSYKSYLPGWIKNDWKNAKGQPVKNASEWQEMLNLLNGKPFDIEKGAHEYRKWLLAEIGRNDR